MATTALTKQWLGLKNIPLALFRYVQSSFDELKKVSWPTRKDVIRHTIIILISIAIATLIIAGIDYLLGQLVNYFLIK